MRVMIAGRRRRGKDTMAELIQEYRPEVVRASFAEPLKVELARMTRNWLAPLDQQDELRVARLLRDREVMGPGWQWWGEFWRQMNEDHWIRVFDLRNGHLPNVVVSDLRHHNEAEYGRQNNFLLVRVTGPFRGLETDVRNDNHPSEIHIDELPVDLEYYNNGTIDDMREFVVTEVIPQADRLFEARGIAA